MGEHEPQVADQRVLEHHVDVDVVHAIAGRDADAAGCLAQVRDGDDHVVDEGEVDARVIAVDLQGPLGEHSDVAGELVVDEQRPVTRRVDPLEGAEGFFGHVPPVDGGVVVHALDEKRGLVVEQRLAVIGRSALVIHQAHVDPGRGSQRQVQVDARGVLVLDADVDVVQRSLACTARD